MKIFVTGIAGFIGFHTALALHKLGYKVDGCDNFNHYYDPALKRARAAILLKHGISVIESSLENIASLSPLFEATHIIHLAAQAGVRYSIDHPHVCIDANINGFVHLLECIVKRKEVKKLIFASSSSVYGLNQKIPFREDDPTDAPSSLYGASKKANELIAHAYHHLYGLPMIGLRFFTVYGPWGRPDMAYYSFTHAIQNNLPITVYGNGELTRDFTYIDDIVNGIIAALEHPTDFDIFNLGNNHPESVNTLIAEIEKRLNKTAHIIQAPKPASDVICTYADISKSAQALGYDPKTPLAEGLNRFINWYLETFTRCPECSM